MAERAQATVGALERALTKAKVSPSIRHELAVKLWDGGASPGDVHQLEAEVHRRGGSGPGLLVQWLRDGSWRGILEQAKSGAAREAEALERQQRAARGTSSSIRFVTEDNPYGWADPERMRGSDHGDPKQWNPFRQSFNGAMRKRPNGSYDCRMFGSARAEVVGASGEASAEWDGDAVKAARQFREGSEPVSGRAKRDEPDEDFGDIYPG